MIFVLSDTHVPERMERLPRKLIDRMGAEDLVFHAGDFVGWEVFRELAGTATLHAVRGNMDHPRVRRSLPETKLVEIQGKTIGICHGSGSPVNLAQKVHGHFGQKCDVLIFGHSHVPYNAKIGDTLMLNPGSLSWNMAPPFVATYAVLTIEGDQVWAEILELK